jgi:hypothetical protein
MAEDRDRTRKDAERSDEGGMSDEEIDLNLEETFPASDPPSWTLGTEHQSGTASRQDDSTAQAKEPSHKR